jgi:cobalt/nickel transport system ATP-binding protein
MFLLELQDLTFGYLPQRPVINALNFRVAPSERIGVVGSNGTGKTTLLHLMVGLLTPQHGTVLFKGKACHTEHDFTFVRKSVSLLFQDVEDQLFCPTVLEDVAFGPLNQGLDPSSAFQRSREALDLLGLRDLTDRPIYHLSRGEKQLVALAGLLAMTPELYLLDEPTTGLDSVARARVLEMLRGLPSAFVVVSHDAELLDALGCKVYVLKDGRLALV